MKHFIVYLLMMGCVIPFRAASSKGQTPYEMLIQSRRKDTVQEVTSTHGVGPVVARAQLRLVPVRSGENVACFDLQVAQTTTVKPAQVHEVPSDIPREPVYFTVRAGQRELTGITYRSVRRPQDVKLFLDTDGDGGWSDEVEYPGFWQYWFSLERTYMFGPISTQPAGIDGAVFHAQCAGGKRVVFYPTFYRRGQVTLKGKTYNVALVDTDFDAKYNDAFVPPAYGKWSPGCDTLIVDPNRNPEQNFSRSKTTKFMPLSQWVELGGTYYGLDVAPDGSTIDFREANVQYGQLDLGQVVTKLTLYSQAGTQHLSGVNGRWRLPAGRYCAVELELTDRDTAGNQWQFAMDSHGMETLGDFEIQPDRTTSFQLGPPFQIKTSMKTRADKVIVSFSLQGQGAVRYKPGVTRNDKTVPEPAFKIFDTAGKVVHSGRFEYG